MDDDDVMRKARAAVVAARKTIAEAERALKRTDTYFRLNGIDPEDLVRQLEARSGPGAKQEIESMVALALQDVKREADEAIREARRLTAQPYIHRKPRQLI